MNYRHTLYFSKKMWEAFALAKATHIFQQKYLTGELDIILTRRVNILAANRLIKLTMLWTTGPWYFSYFSMETYVVDTH